MDVRTITAVMTAALTLGCMGEVDGELVADSTETAAAPRSASAAPATEVRFGRLPGEIIFDASNGKIAMQVPDRGMKFASEQALYRYLISELNALPSYDSKGRIAGVHGTLYKLGAPFYGDATWKRAYEVQDPIVALIGGKEATVYIGGEPRCLLPEVCGEIRYSVSDTEEECDDGFCAKGVARSISAWFYVAHGAETIATEGGYRTDVWFCWKGWVPWVCSRTVGDNQLTVDAAFEFDIPPGPFDPPQRRTENNVSKVQIALWGIGFSFSSTGGVPGSYCGQFYPNTPPPECLVSDLCGFHEGIGSQTMGEGSVAFHSDKSNFCEDIGVE